MAGRSGARWYWPPAMAGADAPPGAVARWPRPRPWRGGPAPSVAARWPWPSATGAAAPWQGRGQLPDAGCVRLHGACVAEPPAPGAHDSVGVNSFCCRLLAFSPTSASRTIAALPAQDCSTSAPPPRRTLLLDLDDTLDPSPAANSSTFSNHQSQLQSMACSLSPTQHLPVLASDGKALQAPRTGTRCPPLLRPPVRIQQSSSFALMKRLNSSQQTVRLRSSPFSGVSSQKKPRFKEQGSRSASREHVVPPKKRKAPHVRRSKRDTSPGVLNDEDWAMLEREEDEQPLKHGKEMKTRKSVSDLPAMQEQETCVFYPTRKHQHGASKYLKRYPSLIFSMLRCTIMPKVGNFDVVRFPYYEVIQGVLSGDKLNMVEWMAARMMECRALDEKFIMQEQFLRDNFIDPMIAKVNSLADQMERMATKEELGELPSEIATQVQATGQLKWTANGDSSRSLPSSVVPTDTTAAAASSDSARPVIVVMPRRHHTPELVPLQSIKGAFI
ncbi:unnamed protein product [Miscanthus lutarioriparius]|uniref:Uncharacterized protein n=1 Tax=Miscanthus lutarioriparius TaxID=422564 RepID=A0A811S716_9POAL|nr:unnamed protein product [Miscanthus lutarioriparius]